MGINVEEKSAKKQEKLDSEKVAGETIRGAALKTVERIGSRYVLFKQNPNYILLII
jgi:RNA-binding protein YhbY